MSCMVWLCQGQGLRLGLVLLLCSSNVIVCNQLFADEACVNGSWVCKLIVVHFVFVLCNVRDLF